MNSSTAVWLRGDMGYCNASGGYERVPRSFHANWDASFNIAWLSKAGCLLKSSIREGCTFGMVCRPGYLSSSRAAFIEGIYILCGYLGGKRRRISSVCDGSKTLSDNTGFGAGNGYRVSLGNRRRRYWSRFCRCAVA